MNMPENHNPIRKTDTADNMHAFGTATLLPILRLEEARQFPLYDRVFAKMLDARSEMFDETRGMVALRLFYESDQIVIHNTILSNTSEAIQLQMRQELTQIATSPELFRQWGEEHIAKPQTRLKVWQRAVVYYLFHRKPDSLLTTEELQRGFSSDFMNGTLEMPHSYSLIKEGVRVGIIEEYLESKLPPAERNSEHLSA